jgi:hypothetical protein
MLQCLGFVEVADKGERFSIGLACPDEVLEVALELFSWIWVGVAVWDKGTLLLVVV